MVDTIVVLDFCGCGTVVYWKKGSVEGISNFCFSITAVVVSLQDAPPEILERPCLSNGTIGKQTFFNNIVCDRKNMCGIVVRNTSDIIGARKRVC